jgi:RNA polymerase sigma factor (sigma-70 family)
MTTTNPVLQHLRRVVLGYDGTGLTDGQLLDRFLVRHEDDAFAALVRRHGRMVLGVCRRVLNHAHDAEDAFQATFLVLVRKAATLRSRQTVGDFLHGVAYHTALKARAVTRRRREKERLAAPTTSRVDESADHLADALELLDRELHHLPEKYRVPVVLCDLEGKTHQEAAQSLGWPQGTVSGRLFRARNLLARRMRRHGALVTGAALASVLLREASAVAVPAALSESTIRAATAGVIAAPVAALIEGVLHAMSLTHRKIAAAIVLVVALLSSGTGILMHRASADKPKVPAPPEKAIKGKEAAGEVVAIVESVDAAKSTLTLASKVSGVKKYDVAKDARIFLDDGTGGKLGFAEGKLADLTAGTTVTVRLAEDGNTVLRIWAEGPTIHGVLKKVEADRRTVTVTFTARKGEAEGDGTFEVLPEASIVIQGRGKGASEVVKLADLPGGAIITLKLSADHKRAGSIQIEGPEVRGVLQKVDGDKNSITVNVDEGTQLTEKTFAISPQATVSIDDGKGPGKGGKPGPARLTDLPVGAHVILRLSPDQKSVLSVSAQGATISGTVKAVEAAKNSITLTVFVRKGDPGEDRTFVLAKDAAVWIDGKESKLADLPVEAAVTVRLSPDQKHANSIQAEGRSTYGTVKAVDAGANSITLADKTGEHTLAVSKDASISIDGKPGKLADVPVESEVSAKLTVDQRTIVSLGCAGRTFQGVLKGVDVANAKVTVSVLVNKTESEDRVFDLAKEVQVVTGINQVPVKLAELKGDKAVALQMRADQKVVLRITVVGE